jgi:hypothetical protein
MAMNQQLARNGKLARRRLGRIARRLLGAALVVCLLASLPAHAAESDAIAPPAAAAATALPAAPPPPPPVSPAFDVRSPSQEQPQPSVFHRWWFWTAVGAVAAATVVVIVVSSRGKAPPATDLGNQEFRP